MYGHWSFGLPSWLWAVVRKTKPSNSNFCQTWLTQTTLAQGDHEKADESQKKSDLIPENRTEFKWRWRLKKPGRLGWLTVDQRREQEALLVLQREKIIASLGLICPEYRCSFSRCGRPQRVPIIFNKYKSITFWRFHLQCWFQGQLAILAEIDWH